MQFPRDLLFEPVLSPIFTNDLEKQWGETGDNVVDIEFFRAVKN